VEQVDQKLQELQMENLILKGIGNNKDRDRERERDRENSPVRKNGSIKYL
jgi:hypothetical protein